jgi:hypothetical protein
MGRSAKRSRRRAQFALEGQIESVDDLRKGGRQFSPWLPRLASLARRRVSSFRFAEEGANRAHAASAFRRTAQRRIDVADARGAIQRRYGRPNRDVRQHVTRTNDHPRLPGDRGPHRGFLYNPSLNKGLRYKGFGGYLVERDPLRQWGQAHFRMNAKNRWPAQLRLCFNRLSCRGARPGRRLRIRQPPPGTPSRRASRQHRSRSGAAPIEAGEADRDPHPRFELTQGDECDRHCERSDAIQGDVERTFVSPVNDA